MKEGGASPKLLYLLFGVELLPIKPCRLPLCVSTSLLLPQRHPVADQDQLFAAYGETLLLVRDNTFLASGGRLGVGLPLQWQAEKIQDSEREKTKN